MEHYNYNGKEIIGIDHGFGNIKCRHVVFRSGVKAYDSEPAMTSDALFYEGKYYVVGEEHKGFVSDKSQDEDYYILTVAALAKELEFRHITECEAVLAVGLPIQWIGAQKEAFRKYLMRNELIEFRYHGQDYAFKMIARSFGSAINLKAWIDGADEAAIRRRGTGENAVSPVLSRLAAEAISGPAFARGRKSRGCGNCVPPASAPGSGGPQFPRHFAALRTESVIVGYTL